jgi:glutaredoxin
MKNLLTLIVLAGLLTAGWLYRDKLSGIFTTAGTTAEETLETLDLPAPNLPEFLSRSSATPHPAREAQARATAIYPGLAKPDSQLNKKFVAFYREAQQNDPRLLTRPDWPIELAERAMVSLGGAPMPRDARAPNASGMAAAAPAARPTAKKVVIYTTSRCVYCTKAKQYMAKKGVRYREVNIDSSITGKEEYRKLGGNGVPLIMVGDQKLEGFSETSLDRALM